MKTAVPLVIVAMFVVRWIAPAENSGQKLSRRKIVGNSLVVTDEGMWAKDANDFIHIQRINNATSIQDVSIYRFDDQRKLEVGDVCCNGEYDSTKSALGVISSG